MENRTIGHVHISGSESIPEAFQLLDTSHSTSNKDGMKNVNSNAVRNSLHVRKKETQKSDKRPQRLKVLKHILQIMQKVPSNTKKI